MPDRRISRSDVPDSRISRSELPETEDEASSSCEKHTGKDSGIEDEDTPRESEQGSKLSLLERTSVECEEDTIVEENTSRRKGELFGEKMSRKKCGF